MLFKFLILAILLVSSHLNSYFVFIFFTVNCKILAPGEKLCIAVDLAAQDALLKLWNVSSTSHTFPFTTSDEYKTLLEDFNKQNHSIREVCDET